MERCKPRGSYGGVTEDNLYDRNFLSRVRIEMASLPGRTRDLIKKLELNGN